MKIAITGATGLVGRGLMDIISRARPDWELTALSRNPFPAGMGYRWQALDVGDTEASYKIITRLNPDLVIHAAAMARPEHCDQDAEGAFRANFLGTRNIVLACMRFDTELLYISTDQVFYGAPPKAHDEYDLPIPNNYYAQTKLLGELYVREHLERFWIVRMGKVFGGPGDTYSFMLQAYNALKAGKTIKVATDWSAHMMHSYQFASAAIKLVEKKTYGIYHLVHPDMPTYQQAAQYLAKCMEVQNKLLIPVTQKELGLSLARTSHLELSTRMWRADFGDTIPSWKEGIKQLVSERVKV